MRARAGETVLLKEGTTMRWVRIVHAAPVRENGLQCVTVQPHDQYGRATPRRVTLGGNASVEWVS